MHVVGKESLGIFTLMTEKKIRSVEFRHLSRYKKFLSCLRTHLAWCSHSISQFKTASLPGEIKLILHAIRWICNQSEEQRCLTACMVADTTSAYIGYIGRMAFVPQTTSWLDSIPDPYAKQIHLQGELWVWLCLAILQQFTNYTLRKEKA